MSNLLSMKVREACAKNPMELANTIWEFKNPGIQVDEADREYLSWKNSLPHFLGCVKNADLGELYVVFEMKTPMSNKAIDVLLLGYGDEDEQENRILIVELKQWSRISTQYVNDPAKVYVPEAKATRRHPMRQLNLYENNLRDHHSGIRELCSSGRKVSFGKIAYLHNFEQKTVLYTDKYSEWENYGDYIFGGGSDEKRRLPEKNRLTKVLAKCFINKSNDALLSALGRYEAVMGDEGLVGLRKAYENQESLKMRTDQQKLVDFVNDRLNAQKENPHQEMIVISGGPGTGKTIVGIRFILEYIKLFNNGANDNKAIFCLPKSQTVKAMFDAACSVDEENEKEYCCYLQEIAGNQNLVVVDEAHRITDLENTLNQVFEKGTNLLILMQDDHQLLRPGEEGTYEAFRDYALKQGIAFSPANEEEKDILTLVDEKRCDEKLLQRLTKLFYEDVPIKGAVDCVKVFDDLRDLQKWEKELSQTSKTKFILPFCWEWKTGRGSEEDDIVIGEFKKKWNPADPDDQVVWLNNRQDDRAACIYTSQGLDMDNVAFIWWDDLRWDAECGKWIVDLEKLKDSAFKYRFDSRSGSWKQWKKDQKNEWTCVHTLSQAAADMLIKNTYYVMLSRPRNQLGIWFKDEATKRHVMDVLGLNVPPTTSDVRDRLQELNERIRKFNTDRDWDQFHTPSNLAKSISIEAGELLECFQWSDTQYDRGNVLEELADVTNFCLQMAQVLGVDIIDVVHQKMDITEKKYPVEKSKGTSVKYDKL